MKDSAVKPHSFLSWYDKSISDRYETNLAYFFWFVGSLIKTLLAMIKLIKILLKIL